MRLYKLLKKLIRPFFLFFSHYAVHTPLQGKEEYIKYYESKGNELTTREVLVKIDDRAYSRRRQSNPVYAANIQSLDESIGRVMDTLRELGLEDETIIVFTSDNGGFSTTKGGNPQVPTSNLPLRFGKGWMYEGGLRVPTIVKYPGKVPASDQSELLICGYDFYPTLLALAKIPLLPDQHVDGLAIFDNQNRKQFSKRSMFWYYPQKHVSGHTPSAAVRKGDYKLILDLNTKGTKLFDVREDISEAKDLSLTKRRVARGLETRLQAFIKENQPNDW